MSSANTINNITCITCIAAACCAQGADEEVPAPVHDDLSETGPDPADRPAGHGAGLPTGAGRVSGPGGGRRLQPDVGDGHRDRLPAVWRRRRRRRRCQRDTGRRGQVAGPRQRVRRRTGRVPDGAGRRVPWLAVHQRQAGRHGGRGEHAQAQQSDARQNSALRLVGDR